NYHTDLLSPLVALAKQLAGADPSADLGAGESPFRVIADHARATAFLIADGVFPDKTGRSYVLRRIMRRAIRYGTTVGLDQAFFHTVCDRVVEDFGEAYPELGERRATIAELVQIEEEAFRRTLDRGIRLLDAAIDDLEKDAEEFPPEVAADLYDTYGFPIDLTGVICREHKLGLREEEVELEVARRQQSSAAGALGSDRALDRVYLQLKQAHASNFEFVGYTHEACQATVLAILQDGQPVQRASAGASIEVVCDRSPFYGESGGQMGDHGQLTVGETNVVIVDTKKPTGDLAIHHGTVDTGTLEVGAKVSLQVDSQRRSAIRRNHSATHLLHLALREALGPHVVQKGSLVAPDRLRFDFSHSRPLTREQRQEVERQVNRAIVGNAATGTKEMTLPEAKKAGAIGLFGEKYGAQVRVVTIGGDSVELCGGTHVSRAGDIGLFVIVSEEGIAQGVRRIEAVTGTGAIAYVQQVTQTLAEVATAVHAPSAADIPERVEKLQSDLRAKHREVEGLQRKLATGADSGDTPIEVEGIKVLAKVVAVANPKALREAADTLRNRLGSG
ncbi:MAG: alanine--tRNA ligase, partial [Nannocystaceae bacterium]